MGRLKAVDSENIGSLYEGIVVVFSYGTFIVTRGVHDRFVNTGVI